ncbi:hypothetical protein OC25_08515 [Pedobacter kyungheensis]|uniref:Uncharacterized protein n=1 Tax=Pedobacter kyungheensis TaxID=1069985 RepID=A0A0C1DBQ7_9SPHI|nr:hypothetical protein OC25_08515 [Pedobacter kyungheensis]
MANTWRASEKAVFNYPVFTCSLPFRGTWLTPSLPFGYLLVTLALPFLYLKSSARAFFASATRLSGQKLGRRRLGQMRIKHPFLKLI